MMTKPEIGLLAVTVLGTLTAWLAAPQAFLDGPAYDSPSTACSVPASELRGAGQSLGVEKARFDRASMLHALS